MQAQKITFSQNQEAAGDKTAYARSKEEQREEEIRAGSIRVLN